MRYLRQKSPFCGEDKIDAEIRGPVSKFAIAEICKRISRKILATILLHNAPAIMPEMTDFRFRAVITYYAKKFCHV